ncbi:amidohydrolase family protein [Dyadobacter luticola]|nr:amidohydrolase family protein [Dyadobacter luticola]
MKKLTLFTLLIFISFTPVVLAGGMPADSGVFILHKFQQRIGREVYRVSGENGAMRYDVDFKFVDRGSPVPLTAMIRLNAAFEPVDFFAEGKTSRLSQIKDSIHIENGTAFVSAADTVFTQKVDKNTFPIDGYSPATAQELLLKFWKKRGQPAHITTLPAGDLQILKDGTDQFTLAGKKVTLTRYMVSGLIWGNEMLWADGDDNLACILTIDAEGDKTEMVREVYEPLLDEFISRGAAYGMAAFAKTMTQTENANVPVLIRGGQVIDIINGVAAQNDVLIENRRISKIGKNLTAPKNAKVIDATGKTVLPGLWDMHAHFEQTEWGPAYLAAGVTTVRDCGNEIGFIAATQKAIDTGKGVGPKILMAGIIDGKGPIALGVIQANTPDEAIKAVRNYKEKGFDQIKIYSSIKPEILKVISDEAHRLGLTVTGHVPQGMNLRQAAGLGMDMVNHLPYVTQLMKRDTLRRIDFADTASISAIEFVKQKPLVVDPTIGVYTLWSRSLSEDITLSEPAFYTLPLTLQSQFKSTGVDSATARRYKPALESMGMLVKKLYDQGVPIVAGTDMGFPGYSLPRELELYVEAGLTPAQALKTATITPAEIMGKDKQTGSIVEGKDADLIIVDGNPLTRIRDVRNVKVVVKGGVVYDPGVLHRMVGFNVK